VNIIHVSLHIFLVVKEDGWKDGGSEEGRASERMSERARERGREGVREEGGGETRCKLSEMALLL